MKHRNISNQLRYACSKQAKYGISKRAQKKQNVRIKENVYSSQTMKKMKTLAGQLGEYVRKNYPDVRYVYEITPEMTRRFITEKAKDWRSQATRTEKLSQLSKLETICQAAFSGSEINFMEGIDRKIIFNREGKAPVRDIAMTEHDYRVLEDKCLSSRSKARFIPMITYKIGSRLEEAASITPENIDLDRKVVRLTNCKNGRKREIPIHKKDESFFSDLKKMCVEKNWPTVCGGLTPGSVAKFISRSLSSLYKEGKVNVNYNAHKTGNHAIRKLFARRSLAEVLNVKEEALSSVSKKALLQAWPEIQVTLGHGPRGREDLFKVYIGDYI